MINAIKTDEAEAIGIFIDFIKITSLESIHDCIYDSNGFVIGLMPQFIKL